MSRKWRQGAKSSDKFAIPDLIGTLRLCRGVAGLHANGEFARYAWIVKACSDQFRLNLDKNRLTTANLPP
jgi:hypothetical protein